MRISFKHNNRLFYVCFYSVFIFCFLMDLVIGPGILLGGIIKPIEPLGIAMLMAFIISLLVKYVVEKYVQKRKGSIFEGE